MRNNFQSRYVRYDDRLVLSDPRLLLKADHFVDVYDDNRALMTLHTLCPDDWSEQSVLRRLTEQNSELSFQRFRRIVDPQIAMKVEFSHPTMAFHLSENTRLLELQANKIEKDQIDLQRQYFLKDYHVIEQLPCRYYFRSVREAFRKALPADDRRQDKELERKIPEALSNAVEYDRLAKWREVEVQNILIYERTAVIQSLNSLMICLHENWNLTPDKPNRTCLRPHCCSLSFEGLRMLVNIYEYCCEATKSVLRQDIHPEYNLRDKTFGPVPTLLNQRTGLLAYDQRSLHATDGSDINTNFNILPINLPRRVVDVNTSIQASHQGEEQMDTLASNVSQASATVKQEPKEPKRRRRH